MTGFKEIECSKISIIDYSILHSNFDEGIDGLSDSIKKYGLITPITVYEKSDGRFEILIGGRRFRAFNEINKKYPGEGWDKIQCVVIDEPKTNEEKEALLIGETFSGITMMKQDLDDTCETLFKKYNDLAIVAEMTGLSKILVSRWVKFARLPKILQDNVDSINKNPNTAMNIILEAVDALDYVKDGEVPEKKVLDFAKMLGEKKKKSNEEYTKLKQAAEKNPNASLEQIEEESQKSHLYKI